MTYPNGFAPGNFPSSARASQFHIGGCFTANLGPLLPGKELGFVPPEVELALLSHPPVPEGIGYVELECDGYERQKVQLVPGAGSGIDVNMLEFAFKLDVSPPMPPTHIAIMDCDNRVLFSSTLMQIGRDWGHPGLLRFRSHDFQVRRPIMSRLV